MKKIVVLLSALLLALGAQAASGVHRAKGATLAQAKSKSTLSAKGASAHKAGAKAQLRKSGSAHKHVAHAKPGRKAPRKHG